MATFKGAETVSGGYYFNTREWKLSMVEAPTGVLPGDDGAPYVRVPVIAMLVLAPLMGLVFVLAVPFVGLAVIVEHLWKSARTAFAAKPDAVNIPRR